MNILSTSPSQASTNQLLDLSIAVTFDTPIDASSVDASSLIVSTKKTNILTSVDGVVQPGGIFGTDNFFDSEYTGIISGTFSVASDTITFVPDLPLKPSTEYTVDISKTIKGTDTSLLGTFYRFTFTTHSQDIVEPLGVIPKTTSVIGTYIDFSGNKVTTKTGFYVDKVSPQKDSFLIQSKVITITFSNIVDASTISGISVSYSDIMSDYPPSAVPDLTIASVNKTVTVTIGDSVDIKNKVFFVNVPTTLKDNGGLFLDAETLWTYIADLNPYYSSTKLIRLYAGTVLTSIPDSSIAMCVHINSLEADNYLYNKKFAVRIKDLFKQKWVLYSTLNNILMNNNLFGTSDFVKKHLAEFDISLSNKSKIDMYNELLRDSKENIKLLKFMILDRTSGGYFRKGSSRGAGNGIGRLWQQGNMFPGLNSRVDVGVKDVLTWKNLIRVA